MGKVYGQLVKIAQKKGIPASHIDMFHAHLEEGCEIGIPEEFLSPESNIRCLVCTIAFGMGMQVPDIRYVIHWGPPGNVLNYFQEIGRCARDGLPGKAILYRPKYSMRSDMCSKDMLDIVHQAQSTCIRYSALKAIKVTSVQESDLAKCCFGSKCCSFCDQADKVAVVL